MTMLNSLRSGFRPVVAAVRIIGSMQVIESSTSTSTLKGVSPALASASTSLIFRRRAHNRVSLPYHIDSGLPPFLSPQALRTIAVDWQHGCLVRLNELVRGTLYEDLTVLQTLQQTATDPSQALTFNYASEALNNSFFLSTLSSRASELAPNSELSAAIARSSLGSLAGVISHFSAHVAGLHPSSGAYIWLVTDRHGNIGVVGTYAGGTVLVQNRRQMSKVGMVGGKVVGEVTEDLPELAAATAKDGPPSSEEGESASSEGKKEVGKAPRITPETPNLATLINLGKKNNWTSPLTDPRRTGIYGKTHQLDIGKHLHPLCCISVHEHCYIGDYGVWGREEYVKNWWGAINWENVQESFDGFIARQDQ